jgi:hypothetical protein
MEGFVLVTNPYYRWYFISFWTIAVIVILNLVIAFVLEAFFQKDEQYREAAKREEDQCGGSRVASGKVWSTMDAEEQHELASVNVAAGSKMHRVQTHDGFI